MIRTNYETISPKAAGARAVRTPPPLKREGGRVKMIVGYAWISPAGVDRELQIKVFDQTDVEELVIDEEHNSRLRQQKLRRILSRLQSGSTFVVYSLDALGLSFAG